MSKKQKKNKDKTKDVQGQRCSSLNRSLFVYFLDFTGLFI